MQMLHVVYIRGHVTDHMMLYHVLHADGDFVVDSKVAKEAHDVRGVTLMQDL